MTVDPQSSIRRRRSADERRDQIIRAATEVVVSNGYVGATLTEIARTAGIAKGLLWHYFDDRDDLMHQVLESLVRRLRADLVAGLDVTASAPDVIRAVFVRTASFTRTHGVELEAIDQVVHNLRAPDGRRRITVRDYEEVYREHEALLRRGQAEGTVRPGDVRTLAVAYQALIDGVIGHLQAHPEDDPTEHAERAADVFLTGVSQPSERSAD